MHGGGDDDVCSAAGRRWPPTLGLVKLHFVALVDRSVDGLLGIPMLIGVGLLLSPVPLIGQLACWLLLLLMKRNVAFFSQTCLCLPGLVALPCLTKPSVRTVSS